MLCSPEKTPRRLLPPDFEKVFERHEGKPVVLEFLNDHCKAVDHERRFIVEEEYSSVFSFYLPHDVMDEAVLSSHHAATVRLFLLRQL